MSQCQDAFDLLKQSLMKELILHYPDPNKEYTLCPDASKQHGLVFNTGH